MNGRAYNTGAALPPGAYSGAFSFAMNVAPRVGGGQVIDLYATPGSSGAHDADMFNNLTLRGLPMPKTQMGGKPTRADNLGHEGFSFKIPASESFQMKIGSREPFQMKVSADPIREAMTDRDFNEGLDNDSLGVGEKGRRPRGEPSDNRSAARMRFVGGLDDV